MTDSVLDLVLLIALLGIVIAVGFALIIPTVNDSANQSADFTDKTASSLDYYNSTGESNNEYDGALNKAATILVTQVQDYGMPNPRVLEMDGQKMDITSIYRDERIAYATVIWNHIKGDAANVRYTFTYDNRNPAVDGDEVQMMGRVTPAPVVP